MPYKVFRLVNRDALSTERLLEVLLRMCPTCEEKAFDAYFVETQLDDVALAFCKSCPFNRPPEGTEDGCAYPLVDYLCWTYICDAELLPHVLAVHAEQLDELLQGQVLVIEKGGRTKELNYAGLVTAGDDTQRASEVAPLRFPQLPCILHRDGINYKYPMEIVYNFFPSYTT